ncbi:MAG: hypothetical protein AAGF88_05505 [Pseudomonadota bacterium]
MSKVLLGPDGTPVKKGASQLKLTRRAFAGGALATPFLAQGAAATDPEDEINDAIDLLDAVFFQGQGGTRLVLTAVLVVTAANELLFANISQGAPKYDENRIGTSALLGGLTRPTIPERLENAVVAGNVRLFETILVLQLERSIQIAMRLLQLVIAHRQLSWDILRFRQATGINGSYDLAVLRGAELIGTLFQIEQNRLLALVPPPTYGS